MQCLAQAGDRPWFVTVRHGTGRTSLLRAAPSHRLHRQCPSAGRVNGAPDRLVVCSRPHHTQLSHTLSVLSKPGLPASVFKLRRYDHLILSYQY